MAKSVKSELNKYLKEMSRTELEKEVKKLYSKFKEVKQYYELEFATDTTKIVNEYKAKIKKEYFSSRGGYGKARNGVSRKIVNDFKKISIFKKDVIDLLLYRAEVMIEYSKITYGDLGDSFYNSLESCFAEACKLINEEQLHDEYKSKCEDLVDETYNIGWGMYDRLYDIYGDWVHY